MRPGPDQEKTNNKRGLTHMNEKEFYRYFIGGLGLTALIPAGVICTIVVQKGLAPSVLVVLAVMGMGVVEGWCLRAFLSR